MKKIIILYFILLVGLLLTSCEKVPSKEPDFTKEETVNEESEGTITIPTLEPEKKDLPLYGDLCKIESGMNYADVYAILGNPQRTINKDVPSDQWFSSINPYTFYIYDSTEGKSIWISYKLNPSHTQLCVDLIDITDTDLAQ